MKTLDIPVTEQVYAFLITGYSRSGLVTYSSINPKLYHCILFVTIVHCRILKIYLPIQGHGKCPWYS